MDDLDDRGGVGDESKRKTRNASEKKRRDQFNILVTELGTMVSPNNRKMDKTTVLKSTIAFLKQYNESSVKSQVHEIQEDWKPSFLSNEEFTHLMLEALEGFILVFTTEGSIVYASEGITSLLGYLPNEVTTLSIYEMISEIDKPSLYSSLMNPTVETTGAGEIDFFLHMKRGGIQLVDKDDDDEPPRTELVKLSGYFRKWQMPTPAGDNSDGHRDNSDDECMSAKSGFSRFSNHENTEKTVFVSTARLQTSQLLREIPLIQPSAKSEFTSRYSLEWKFLFLDHRAPPIIGYLSFELLGTSGYDYYHFDDLDRIAQCHEALMQTGEGTSCYHRFLSKGQQWIWLQTRYFITYHQWNSKPEFVVATHKVVNYTDVLKELRKDAKHGLGNHDESEPGSDLKSNRYATTGSPTWSSRSSMFGGSSTGTGVSSRISERQHKYAFNDTASSGHNDDFFPGSEFESISQYINPQQARKERRNRVHNTMNPQHSQQQQQQQQRNNGSSNNVQGSGSNSFMPEDFQLAVPNNDNAYGRSPGGAENNSGAPNSILLSPSSSVVTAGNPQTAANVLQAFGGGPPRPQVVMTPAQVQLQEQLRVKHSQLTKQIAHQQQELQRISEQLLMSQYGLVPVNVSFHASVSTSDFVPVNSLSSSPSPAVAAAGFIQQAAAVQMVPGGDGIASQQQQQQALTNGYQFAAAAASNGVVQPLQPPQGGAVVTVTNAQPGAPIIYSSISAEQYSSVGSNPSDQ